MKIYHSTRLALVAAAISGVLFALVFWTLLLVVSRAESNALRETLRTGLEQATQELRDSPQHPDFRETVLGNPGLTVAVFEHGSRTGLKVGPAPLSPERAAPEVVQLMRQLGTRVLVVGASTVPMSVRLGRIADLMAILWLPLTLLVTGAVWLTARSTFLPLRVLADEADSLKEQGLSARLKTDAGGEYQDFASKINSLLGRVQDLVERQERFSSDAAHELRTPLTIISAAIQEEVRDHHPEAREKALLMTVLAETERLARLVDILLESARAGRRIVPIAEPVSSSDALNAAAARWLDRYTQKQVDLSVNCQDCGLLITMPELEVVLDNLLENALRASSKGLTVRLECEPQGRTTHISVVDQGPGIPDELRTEIFERFVRLDTGRSRREGGFGLGLSLCKRLIEDRGGTIQVQPTHPHGSTFQITLPSLSKG